MQTKTTQQIVCDDIAHNNKWDDAWDTTEWVNVKDSINWWNERIKDVRLQRTGQQEMSLMLQEYKDELSQSSDVETKSRSKILVPTASLDSCGDNSDCDKSVSSPQDLCLCGHEEKVHIDILGKDNRPCWDSSKKNCFCNNFRKVE